MCEFSNACQFLLGGDHGDGRCPALSLLLTSLLCLDRVQVHQRESERRREKEGEVVLTARAGVYGELCAGPDRAAPALQTGQ